MTSPARQVVDTNGTRYRLVSQLGRGGQGTVYEVEGGKLAVKLLANTSLRNRDRLRNQLASVRRLDLSNLEIARPRDMLREPDLGYVMELLTGMVPLASLAYVPKGTKSTGAWYLGGGGLRRRLRLLGRAADVFAALHGRGLAYADPSPQNIFVSAATDHVEVRLIDADNLRHTTVADLPSIYTPTFGAPEVVAAAAPINSLTDAHAFAAIVFLTLSLAHPLLGDDVMSGPPELEDAALAGGRPWVDDPEDRSNQSSIGLPRSIVLSRRLTELAGQAFGVGLRDPRKRPGITAWAERLHAAADGTLTCDSCRASYYFTARECPWCDAPRPPFATADLFISDPSAGTEDNLLPNPPSQKPGPRLFGRLALSGNEPLIMTRRVTRGTSGAGSQIGVVEVEWRGNRIHLRSLDGGQYRLESPTGSRSQVVDEKGCDIPVSAGIRPWSVHLGDGGTIHRVARFFPRAGQPR